MDDTPLKRVEILIQSNRHQEAEKQLREFLSKHPQDAFAQANLAFCLSNQRRYNEGLEYAIKSLEIDPLLDKGHYIKGVILNQLNELDDAVESLQKAIEINPHEVEFHSYLAHIFRRKDYWDEAIRHSKNALKIDPKDLLGMQTLAESYIFKGKNLDEAGRLIMQALESDPFDSNVHAARGLLSLKKGKSRQAIESYREALKHNPNSELAKKGLIEALKTKNIFYRCLLRIQIFFAGYGDQSLVAMLGVFGPPFLLCAYISKHYSLYSAYADAVAISIVILFIVIVALNPLTDIFLSMKRSNRKHLSTNMIGDTVFLAAGILIVIGHYFISYFINGYRLAKAGAVMNGLAFIIAISIFQFFKAKKPTLYPYIGSSLVLVSIIINYFMIKDLYGFMKTAFYPIHLLFSPFLS